MSNIHDIRRDAFMLRRALKKRGYDWWWHSFTGYSENTGKARPFFIEFFTCNPSFGGDEPVFGQTGEGNKPSYLMVKCGTWGKDASQLHRFFGWNGVKVGDGVPFSVKAEDCRLFETNTCGEVHITDAEGHPEWMCDNGHMKWDLKINKQVAFHVGYGAGALFRWLNSFEMYWHAEGMKTGFDGFVEWNGERYRVSSEDCYGYADKNWGGDFTSPWVWLSSNDLTSKITGKKLTNSVFDIGGGRPKVFGIALNRKLLSDFWYEGKSYEFNFSKFWTFTRTKFDCRETETQIIWHVEQETTKAVMITDITCEKSDMLLVNYEAPNGKKLHNRLWNGGNGQGTVKLYCKKNGKRELIDEVICENVGCEYGEYGNFGVENQHEIISKKEKAYKVERLPWDVFVCSMYDVGLDYLDADVVRVLYSADKSKRYVILKKHKGFFVYSFQTLLQFDDDEIQYLRANAKQGYWFDSRDNRLSVFDSIETLENSLVCEPEYKSYFFVGTDDPAWN